MNPIGLIGQLRPIAFFKGLQVVGLGLFSVLAPRYLGPELFGRFAVVLSISTLWMMTSNLGARYVFGRYVPVYASQGDHGRVRELFMHMVVSRAMLVAIGAPLFALFLDRALPGVSTTTLWLSTASFAAMTLASPMFSVFYGFNQLGTSMAREAFGRVALLAAFVAVGASASLERTTTALLLTQGAALIFGIWLCRDLFRFDVSAFDRQAMRSHLAFGFVVFSTNLLLRVPWRLGETALAFAGAAGAQIAFYNIALSAAVAFTRLLGGLTTLQIPELSLRQTTGDGSGRDRSLGVALKYLNVASGLFVLIMFAAGPWAVRHLWGPRFLGVIPDLLLVAPAALAQPFVRTALSLAVVEGRLVRNLELGLGGVAAFVPTAWWLVPRWGGRGATAALLAASVASAIVAIVRLRPTGVLVAARSGRHLLAAAAATAPLVALHGTPTGALAALAVYGVLLGALGVVDRDEIATVLRGLRRLPPAPAPADDRTQAGASPSHVDRDD